MANEREFTRIFSDVHYGDRASRVTALTQLTPLLMGPTAIVCNGDMLDTRTGGPNPAHTAACRAEVQAFASKGRVPFTFLTGNHDPNFSTQHLLEFNDGEVLVVHGDILFEEIVPWGRDGETIRGRILAALADHVATHRRPPTLEERVRIWREIASVVAQRHQSERRAWKYAVNFAVDTVWPPTRIFRILHAWQAEAARATALAREHRPRAKYILLGHTHRPRIHRVPGGPVIINTGSFCAPFGGYAVDISSHSLVVRRVDRRNRAFHPGRVIAEFPLTNG
jgi:predicted phosphodiesterase